MTLEKFTIKAQEAVQEAVNTAQRAQQQTIEPVHLLKGIIEKGKDVTNFIFQKLGVNGQQISMLLDQELQHLPRVQGGQPYLSGTTNSVLLKAEDITKKLGDEFVSIEPLLLALLSVNSTASRILKDAGCTEKDYPKCKRSSCRLINYPINHKTGFFARFLGCLPLCIIKVSRHSDDGFCNFFLKM